MVHDVRAHSQFCLPKMTLLYIQHVHKKSYPLHKIHTHCSVESVVERRHQSLHCRQSVNRSTGCRSLKPRTRLTRVSEDRETPFRDGLKTYWRETSTAQHILYNTNRASPTPPRNKHPQPTQKRLLIKSPSPVRCPRTRFPGPSPSVNPVHWTHPKDPHPKPQVNVSWHRQEDTSQSLFPPYGNNDRTTTHTGMWPTLSEIR
jgi:hypothetical protein